MISCYNFFIKKGYFLPKKYQVALFFTIWFLFFSKGQIYAQKFEVRASLDTNMILIGKQAHLMLELKQDKSLSVQWPVLPDSLGKIEIVSTGTIDTMNSADAGVLHRRQSIVITAFDSGYFVIPPFNFSYITGIDTSIFSSQPLLLNVLIMPVDTTKAIHDIKDLAEVPFSWRDYIGYIIALIALIIIVIAGFFLYKRFGKKTKEEISVMKPKIPPHEIALAALKKLDEEKHWQNGRYKYYHSVISEIIRTFIEQRWEIHAMEQTTDEIIYHPQMKQLSPDSLSELEKLLKLSDLAKFAKLIPLANENEQSMRDAIKFVLENVMVPVADRKEVVPS